MARPRPRLARPAPALTEAAASAVAWQLADAIEDGVALADADGVILLANRRLAAMFGYQRAELPGLLVDLLVPADLRAAHGDLRAAYARAAADRPMGSRPPLVGLRKDGSTFPVRIGLSPVLTTSAQLTLATIRDMTEPQRPGDPGRPGHAQLAAAQPAALPAAAGPASHAVLDSITKRIFEIGLRLQTAPSRPGDSASQAIAEVLPILDGIVRDIHDVAFTTRS